MKTYSRIYFLTYTLPCFNDLYLLFYPAGKKIIPANIAELLTPLGLAHLIADDGSWNKKGRYVVLCTDSFTLADVQHLASVLNDKWDLKCYVNKNGKYHRIIIPCYSILVLQDLLALHIPPMMRHKIGL
jgi:LAGLIDADG DNA endonuclease family